MPAISGDVNKALLLSHLLLLGSPTPIGRVGLEALVNGSQQVVHGYVRECWRRSLSVTDSDRVELIVVEVIDLHVMLATESEGESTKGRVDSRKTFNLWIRLRRTFSR